MEQFRLSPKIMQNNLLRQSHSSKFNESQKHVKVCNNNTTTMQNNLLRQSRGSKFNYQKTRKQTTIIQAYILLMFSTNGFHKSIRIIDVQHKLFS